MEQTRQLLLLRHAKSSWDDPALEDFDRPLARRGLDAATAMGRELVRRGWVPRKALVSPALRARDTWRLVSAGWADAHAEVEFIAGLYEAPDEEILALIRKTSRNVGTLLAVGHNPGIEDLASRLADGRSDAKALDRLASKFPAGALARFEFPGDWSGLGTGTAQLTHFIRPRDM